MKPMSVVALTAAATVLLAGAAVAAGQSGASPESAATPSRANPDASPIYGVTLPEGYRNWQLVAPALEGEPLNELRTVVGNKIAIDAYKRGELPFPDGAVLVKLAWKYTQSPEFKSALVPGHATTVQVMVKDSKKYAASGGWGYGRFIDGKPADLAQHQTCFACHASLVKNRDYVFTRLAP
ncbi:cytochrome P460 family protein [Cupriavidus sp. D384]|uniref:cytochrome P460 family protein n=1 Tax=Cupriavidus sp. D384 TaxID=1538095 RepID=UPI0008378605|nr:cytochrome P460 family protein [Cupriavidus sp. D384]